MIPCLCKQDLGQDGASRGLKWSVGWLPLLTISSLPFKGCWGNLGMPSAPSSSLGLWQLLPSQTTGPESGVSSQEGICPHLPQGPQDSEKCEGWVTAELPALCPGLNCLPSFFLPASSSLSSSQKCHDRWFFASFLPSVMRLPGGLVSGSLGRKSERDWRVMGDSLQTSHFVPRDSCYCKPLLLKLELACILLGVLLKCRF